MVTAEATASNHEHDQCGDEEEQNADAIAHGDVRVVDAVVIPLTVSGVTVAWLRHWSAATPEPKAMMTTRITTSCMKTDATMSERVSELV